MNKAQLNATTQGCINASKPFIIVEHRGGKAETIKYTDKKGKSAEFSKFTMSCETLGDDATQLAISRDLTEDEKKVDVKTLKSPYKRGARLFIVLSGYNMAMGKAEARAISCEVIED
jgi:hypothetical protein